MHTPVKKDVNILLVEDEVADAELVKYALREGGMSFSLKRVETKDEFLRELDNEPLDLILSDYGLPTFDGFEALEIAQQKRPEIPFIFVTGTLGEERAIETLKRGASDYVLKTRLSQLIPSVHRTLRVAEARVERRRAEQKLHESHEQLRALSVYLQYVREEERTRIAREVHDELGQALTGLKFEITVLRSSAGKAPKPLLDGLRTVSSRIDTIIQTVRRISTELRPGILDDLGLVAAIEWQANEFQTRTGVQCDVIASVKELLLSDSVKTAFFRIFQETLTNVLRHSNAKRVEVKLTEGPNQIRLEVHDNGRGIASKEISSTKSLGLIGMRERAVLLGGEFHILGVPGQGTTVSVSIPSDHAAHNRRAA